MHLLHTVNRVQPQQPVCAQPYLFEIEVHHGNEVQGMCIVVIIWVSITVIHPQLDESPLTGNHVNCMDEEKIN